MFDRFIRLAKAKKALQAGRLEEAIQLADDPLVKEDRRALDLRQRAVQALFERAKRRSEDGNPAVALVDLECIRKLGGYPGADALAVAVQRRLAEQTEQDGLARRENAEARRLAEHGQLPAAMEMHRQAEARSAAIRQERSVANFIAERRNRAEAHLAAAADYLHADEATRALAEYRRAVALDRTAAEQAVITLRLQRITGDRLAAALAAAVAAGDLVAALRCCREQLGDWPALREETAVAEALAILVTRLRSWLREGPPDLDSALVRQLATFELPLPSGGDEVCRAARLLVQAGELRDQGKLAELLVCWREASGCLGGNAFVEQVDRLVAATTDGDAAIERARGLAAGGDLDAARGELTRILQQWPMHEIARRELAIIDQGSQDREQRLQSAREAARAGRLREALALALAQAVAGPAGEAARMLATEVRARVDLVGRGLDQVRGALHGREAATADGVQHCLKRVEELGKVAVDHEEIPGLIAALQAELAGLGLCDQVQAALEQRAWRVGAQLLEQLLAVRQRLLTADRLDARALGLADRFLRAAEDCLSTGRLDDLTICLGAVDSAAVANGDLIKRTQSLRATAAEQRERAESLVTAARCKLADRDLAEAERLVDAARQVWVDSPGVRKLGDDLQSLRQQTQALDSVAELAAEQDFGAAHRRLGEMPPTPPLLRTRIYDMKQSLAKAQGLDGAFLLRVDEGGEYLVLRGESVSIGNVRERKTDLPILANIAGCHARIVRRMSFHGGMQDSIVADGGEVRVGDAKVAKHMLKSGDRFALGSLGMQYLIPSSRSLSACLVLLGGFQVAGTDRVLLLKDRGRDGRLLLGNSQDVHVRVANAVAEVEIFAHKSGQVRVRCQGQGSIDGRPFNGEHPVAAGAQVQAGGISFVLLPWQKG